jgi:Luciferase-like monooxygenase
MAEQATTPAGGSVELGLDTFGDVTVTLEGAPVSHAQVIRNVVDEAVLADELGLDFFGVGEHHREDFAISAPEVVLAAIAARTSRIHLGSAVTVLSSDDPIRVFQRFATVDAVSNGRAEVILGRGSFTESFPLFGFDLAKYEELFEEKLDLFVAALKEEPITWEGNLRPALTGQSVYPKTESGLKAWIGVGGSPESVVRAARHNLPLVLAIIGGDPERFKPYADLFHRALAQLEQPELPGFVHLREAIQIGMRDRRRGRELPDQGEGRAHDAHTGGQPERAAQRPHQKRLSCAERPTQDHHVPRLQGVCERPSQTLRGAARGQRERAGRPRAHSGPSAGVGDSRSARSCRGKRREASKRSPSAVHMLTNGCVPSRSRTVR